VKTILVLSGKGGTGKTTVACSLAVALSRRYRVGIADVDLSGPDVPRLLNVQGEVIGRSERLQPVRHEGLLINSLAFMIPKGCPLLWNGKQMYEAAVQLIKRTDWGDLDFLIIDAPPGCDQPVQAMLREVKPDGAIVVTLPSALAQEDAARILEALAKNEVPLLGEVKNFTHFKCDNCGKVHRVFPDEFSLGHRVLGDIPLDPRIARDRIINDFGHVVENVLKALEKPIRLRKRRGRMKRALLKLLLKLWA